jgi:hypothetical protein
MRASLIIKGSVISAQAKAETFGIKLLSTRYYEKWNETVAECDSDPDTLNRWYTEDYGSQPPHADGSLLLWSEIKPY